MTHSNSLYGARARFIHASDRRFADWGEGGSHRKTGAALPRILQFMVRCGYSVAAAVPLYDSERNDIVLVKFFGDERIPIKMEAA